MAKVHQVFQKTETVKKAGLAFLPNPATQDTHMFKLWMDHHKACPGFNSVFFSFVFFYFL